MTEDVTESDPEPSSGPGCLNCFALVTYILPPLGSFLDQLRRELEPQPVSPRAHVTLLPPRPLAAGVTPKQAIRQLEGDLARFATPFEIEIGLPEVFEDTHVVYLSVGGGWGDLKYLYRCLNTGALSYQEPYPYHPHVTIAQGLTRDEALRVAEEAAQRWEAYTGSRSLMAERCTFVQCRTDKSWLDLASFDLPVPVPS
jgi:2'-5' RNA ligase